jgi:hypothetical protein
LLYGRDISNAKKILFNIYTSSSTEDTPRPKAPSFLDKLKQHLKKGLTDFTRDFDE